MRKRDSVAPGAAAGFTLIELIAVIVILGVVAGLGSSLLVEIVDAWALYKDQRELAESATMSMDRMVREIRRAVSISSADDSDLQFMVIGGDSISFDLSGTTLRRTLNGTANGLAANVDSLTFTYYDISDLPLPTPVATPSDIRRIAAALTLSSGGARLETSSQVSPRRLQ